MPVVIATINLLFFDVQSDVYLGFLANMSYFVHTQTFFDEIFSLRLCRLHKVTFMKLTVSTEDWSFLGSDASDHFSLVALLSDSPSKRFIF